MNLKKTRWPGIYRRGDRYVAIVAYTAGDGKPKRAWLTHNTLTAAKDARRSLLNDLDRGIRPDGSSITLGAYLLDTWLPEVRRERRPTTAATYRKIVNRHIIPVLGRVRLRDLDREHLRLFHRSLTTPALATLAHRVLSSALSYAVKDLGLLAANPCASVRPPRYRAPEAKVLDVQDARRLLSEVRGHELEAAVVLGLLGLRVGEVCAVPWRDVDLEAGSLLVRGSYTGPTKSGKMRGLTLPASETATLRRYRKDQAERLLRIGIRQDAETFVVTDPFGRQAQPRSLSAAFRRLQPRSE